LDSIGLEGLAIQRLLHCIGADRIYLPVASGAVFGIQDNDRAALQITSPIALQVRKISTSYGTFLRVAGTCKCFEMSKRILRVKEKRQTPNSTRINTSMTIQHESLPGGLNSLDEIFAAPAQPSRRNLYILSHASLRAARQRCYSCWTWCCRP
jgi:hypothetical protein